MQAIKNPERIAMKKKILQCVLGDEYYLPFNWFADIDYIEEEHYIKWGTNIDDYTRLENFNFTVKRAINEMNDLFSVLII